MRTIVISCDRCGKEIKGYPIKIVPEYTGRENDDILPDDLPFPDGVEKILAKEFCEHCAKKITRYALTGLKENPEFEKAVEEMVEDAAFPPMKSLEKEDRSPDAGTVTEEKSGRKKIDMGKVMALTKAGWSAAKITDETGISVQGVYDARYRLKKEGKL